ncbi:SMI1/KNR4 family protein [Gallaecimonas kandeliae]|uniref:SMI1/KNR4 family protein n=1 Tax=Gallaecimonas kandeliae TaxID=3029055 RepID=UPI002648B213|nr:SMI1/KNR4 family protein [Gallaecimonas kandeliae]WKE65258.1 SMI1/KNR4 family protein [Gallaecimonas kandeliae]
MDIHSAISELKELRLRLPKRQILPDDEILDSYEKDLGFSFPKDYRYFLKVASDSILNGKDALRVTVDKGSPRELMVFAHNIKDTHLQLTL